MSLRAEHITFGYSHAEPLYRDISLSIEPGERVALQAASGAGKTTLCRLLAGYVRPSAGRVLVDGEPLASVHGGARAVQLIWQHPEQAFDPRMRMGRSLGEAGDVHGAYAQGLMERFGVRKAWLSRRPHELSGGELMRCCLVRALMTRPRYLLCDEATAMLDVVTQAELWRELMDVQAAEDMGMIVVSHVPALCDRVATRVVQLDDLRV